MPSTNAGAGPTAGQTVDKVDDYEYEYDENETEVSRIRFHAWTFRFSRTSNGVIKYSRRCQTFYVDLDLSSLNGVIRPRLQSRKKLIPATTKTVNVAVNPAESTSTPTPAPAGAGSGDAHAGQKKSGTTPHHSLSGQETNVKATQAALG